MDENNRNFMLALVLSVLVLAGWQYFFVAPQMEAQQRAQQAAQTNGQAVQPAQPGVPSVDPKAAPGVPSATPGVPSATPAVIQASLTREAALALSQKRIKIDTPELKGSIALKGARIDDLELRNYKEALKPDSKDVVLLSPDGGPNAYYAQFGWLSGSTEVMTGETEWKVEGNDVLSPSKPVILVYDNGKGLVFRRTIAIDEHYMFTISEEVENKSSAPVPLRPFSFVSRHGEPKTDGFFVLHEGLLGVMGDEGLKEIKYKDIKEESAEKGFAQDVFKAKSGWLGITDKYWATALIPNQTISYQADFRYIAPKANQTELFATYLWLDDVTLAPGAKHSVSTMLFAGAKKVSVIDTYADQYKIRLFEKMIDWGWFPFLTKPLFHALEFFFHFFGNFGVAILFVTVLVKAVFFPLANKSYASMTKMKKLQPEMERIKARYPDDRMKQQQAIMELYRKEQVNPMAGCLPVLIQVPVFFALYKVLYVSIEMRQAPFFGWIQDLSAADPTSIFNLFGLIPWAPPAFLMIGAWPLIMGVTMWVQMKLNPSAPDPTQQMIFNWMPVFFTYLLCSFPAGLVIYWTWNNLLSIAQQWVIMKRLGVEVNLLENLGFKKKDVTPARKAAE